MIEVHPVSSVILARLVMMLGLARDANNRHSRCIADRPTSLAIAVTVSWRRHRQLRVRKASLPIMLELLLRLLHHIIVLGSHKARRNRVSPPRHPTISITKTLLV